jgi:uncharacterized repeat protein (TIGR01451 family)
MKTLNKAKLRNISNLLFSAMSVAPLVCLSMQASQLYQLDNNSISHIVNASDGTEPLDNWFGNVFTAQTGANVITRVDFGVFTTTPNSSAKVVFYRVTDPGGNPALGATRVYTQTFTPFTGDGVDAFLQQINLTSPVSFNVGDVFVVSVFIENVIAAPPSDVYPFFIDTSGTSAGSYWDRSAPNTFNLDDLSAAVTLNQALAPGGFVPGPGHVIIRAFGVAPPPVINCPDNLIVECNNPTVVTYSPSSAFDFNGNPLPVSCTPPSGSDFFLGVSNVVCVATDSLGVSSTCSFVVTIVDTTAPEVTCPPNIFAVAANSAGAVVTYVASATDACGLSSFDCFPPSGSLFPNGTTTVTCLAKDVSSNVGSCSFTVTVGGADLVIGQSASKGSVKGGQTITYEITVTNLGPATAKNVIVNDPTPQGTVFLSATGKSGIQITGPPVGSAGTVVWHLGDLGKDAASSNTLTVTVLVRGNVNIVNTATVTSDTWDPNIANNTATVTTRRTAK